MFLANLLQQFKADNWTGPCESRRTTPTPYLVGPKLQNQYLISTNLMMKPANAEDAPLNELKAASHLPDWTI